MGIGCRDVEMIILWTRAIEIRYRLDMGCGDGVLTGLCCRELGCRDGIKLDVGCLGVLTGHKL